MGTRDAVAPPQEGPQASHRSPAVQAPEHVTSERFPRRARLARRADLDACWTSGRRAHSRHLDLAWRPNSAGWPRLGVVVPRFQQSAVARNLVRRRLREIARRGPLAGLPAVDLVVRARRSAYGAAFADLRADFVDALARIQ